MVEKQNANPVQSGLILSSFTTRFQGIGLLASSVMPVPFVISNVDWIYFESHLLEMPGGNGVIKWQICTSYISMLVI